MPRRRFLIYMLLALFVGVGYCFHFSEWKESFPSKSALPPAEENEAAPSIEVPKQSSAPSFHAPTQFDPRLAARLKKGASNSAVVVVVDALSGVPLEGAKVSLLENGSNDGIADQLRSAKTNALGAVAFDIADGHYIVAVEHIRYLATRRRLYIDDDGSNRVTQVPLHPAILVWGTVRSQSAVSLEGVEVTFSGAQVSTQSVWAASDGSFHAFLAPGRYSVAAFANGPWGDARLHAVEVWYGPEFFLELGGGGQARDTDLEGTVIDEGGPVSGAVVTVGGREFLDQTGRSRTVRISTAASALTDAEGRFRLPGSVRSDAELRISAQGYEQHVAEIGDRAKPFKAFRLRRQRSFFVHVFDRHGKMVRPLKIEGFGHNRRPVLDRQSPSKYASDEYPFELSIQHSRAGQPVLTKTWIREYRPEIVLTLDVTQ